MLFVRHADTDVAMPTDDPPLNARGRQRAELLADFLEDLDVVAGVNAIYASDKRRTQETAAPLAKRLNLPVEIADHHDIDGFMDRVLRDHGGDIVLIVSHSDTIAPLIDELHGSKRLPPFGPDDFDEIYIVTIPRRTARSRRCGSTTASRRRHSSSRDSAAKGLQQRPVARSALRRRHFEQRIRRHHSVGRELGYSRPSTRQRSAISG